MSDKKIVLCFPVSEDDVQRIRSVFTGYEVIVSDQQKIPRDLMHADIFCGHAKVPVDWAAVVDQGRLRWIQSSAAGLDHCLVPAVVNSNILVSGCSGLFSNQVAEHTLALILGAIRRLPTFYQAQQQKQFERLPTDDLHGKNVAIIGFGGNGRRIAELLNPMVDRILVCDQFHEHEIPDYVEAFPGAQIGDLFDKADIVVVSLPLTDSTRQLIGEKQFSRMQAGSYFVNVARGAVVDQTALINALKNQQVGMAVLDVVDPEPLPESNELWQLDNVIITPHVGAQSRDRVGLTTELFCLNATRFENAKTLVNQVDKKLQFPHPEHRLRINRHGELLLPKKLA